MDGFNISQEKLLRSRKKPQHDRTEAEKWADVYLILFPDSDPELIPTPYYEIHDTKGNSKDDPMASAEYGHYEQFLRSELPARVRQELINEIEKELDPVEERLKSRLPEIVRLMQRKLFEAYRRPREPEENLGIRHAADLITQQSSDIAFNFATNDQIAFDIAASDDQLAPFFPTPFAEFVSSFETSDDLMLFPHEVEQQAFSDSAYYSLSIPGEECGESSELSKGIGKEKAREG
ncbi:hypothetical protein NA57DRAFT_59575 [Rhizodiscina lignyota]|uniref:Uncharacterized protein n=1 Tax=Rhizodiscina lignyota TaxID=1504668 RepID=A0A9P4I5L1_9PEZI|nr:hypothetical protein NA57DRAFT_59575 [Rhizodiscina lignyota]